MTVITEAIENIAGLEDNAVVWFYVEDLRPRAEGSGIVTPTRVPVKPVAGVLTTPPLNPGPAKVMYGLSSYDIVIPDSVSPVALWPLIRDYIPQTPPVVDAAVAAKNDAESARDEAQQILDDVAAGVVPDAGVAARVAASGSATRSAVDARVTAVGNATYAPSSGSSNYAQVVALGAGSGTDDTTALNAILAGASGKVVRGRHGENYQISAPIIVPSGVTLDMTGCTVTLKASSNCNMLRNAAFASLRSATLTTTVDSTTVTAVSGFTSADIGRSVVIPGAGPGGLVFTAVITAVASGTSFTISKAAKTAVSAVASTVHVRDKNIAIIGGTWDRGANNGTDNDRMSLMFRRIDGLRISGITYLSTAGKYGLNIADCNDFWVVNPRFVCSSDGVHLIGPCTGGHISGVRGTLGDDAVSLTAVDYTTYNDVVGDIVGIEISDVVASTPTTSLIKFTSADGVLVDKVHCRGLTQLIPTRPTFTFANDTGNVNMGDIYMSQVVGRGSISAGSIKSLTIADWVWDATSNTNIALDIYASVDNLRIRGVTGRHGAYTDAHLVALRGTGTIKALQLSDVDFEGTGINCAVVYFGNVATTVGTLDVSHVRRKGPTGNSSVIDARNTANVITALLLSDILTDGTAWIADLNGTTKVNFANIRALTGGSFNIRAAAVLDISGSGMSTNLYAAITSGASVRSRSFDFGVDVSLLARNNNDRVYNSNGALACGSGPVLCGDTPTFTWKHLHTGATYT